MSGIENLILLSLEFLVYAVFWFCVPFVVAGLMVGLFQTIFSIQDASMPFAVKMLVLIGLVTLKGEEIFMMAASLLGEV